jgi:hypothetical protein
MNKLLCEVLSKCYEISTNTVADVFFEYAAHVNTFSVYVYREGWTEQSSRSFDWIAMSKPVTKGNLIATMAELLDLECELGVE